MITQSKQKQGPTMGTILALCISFPLWLDYSNNMQNMQMYRKYTAAFF